MPGFNSTGPEGQGPRTGRQMGSCKPRQGSEDVQKISSGSEEGVNQGNENFAGRGPGKGRRFGGGRGFGGFGGFGGGRGGRGFGGGRGDSGDSGFGKGRGFRRGRGNAQGPASE